MSRTGRVLNGVGIGYLAQIIITAGGLWITPHLLRQLGATDYGLWLVCLQLTMYLALLDIGVVGLVPREVAYAVGRASSREIVPELPVLFGKTVTLMCWQLPFVIIAATLVWWMLPMSWQGARGPCLAIITVFVLSFPARVLQAFLVGLQDLSFIGLTHIGSWLLGTAVTVTLVLQWDFGLYGLVIGWAATQIASGIAWWCRLRWSFPGTVAPVLAKLTWDEARVKLTSGAWVSLGQVAHVLIQATDLIVISRILGPGAVVPYSLTKKAMEVLSNQPHLLMQAAMPALSELTASASRDHLQRITTALTQSVLLVSGAVCIAVLLGNRWFVTWWIGGSYFGGEVLTALLLAVMLARHWNTTYVYATFCLGQERRILIVTLLDGLVTVASSVVLTAMLGPIGVTLGGLIGVCAVSLPSNVRALADATGSSVRKLGGAISPWFNRFVPLVSVCLAISVAWTPASFWTGAAGSLAGTLVYAAMMWPLLRRPPLSEYLSAVMPSRTALRLKFQNIVQTY